MIRTLQMVACPAFNALSDRLGAGNGRVVSRVGSGVLALPAFYLLFASPAGAIYWATWVVPGFAVKAYQEPMLAILGKLFPSSVWTTGLALTHNLAVATFGGFAPQRDMEH